MHINELFSLKGQCAVVVGGAGKIGAPMSEALAEAGATVYIASPQEQHHLPAAARIRDAGGDARGLTLDQSNEDSVLACLRRIQREAKTPDILVMCGVERPMRKFFDDSTDAWDRSMAINARGLFVACRAFGKAMADQQSGSIINVASIYGVVAPDPALYKGTDFQTEPDYPYTKGGMIMFSKYLASYLAPHNVRVNCIAPGGFFNNQQEPFLSQYVAKVPLRRMAFHDDLKGVTVFLASRASAYVTGAVVTVDGGFTVI